MITQCLSSYLAATTAATVTAILPSSSDDNLRTCVENPSRFELIRASTSNQSTPTTQREEEEEDDDDIDNDENNFFFQKKFQKKLKINFS